MKRIAIFLLFIALSATAFAQHPKKAVKAYAITRKLIESC